MTGNATLQPRMRQYGFQNLKGANKPAVLKAEESSEAALNMINQERERHEIESMLPWHAAGTLDRRDAERVEWALAEDGELAQRTNSSARSSRRRSASTRCSERRLHACAACAASARRLHHNSAWREPPLLGAATGRPR